MEVVMPFAIGDAIPDRAKRDGCGCPEWVIRCVHVEGRTEPRIVLVGPSEHDDHAPPMFWAKKRITAWLVMDARYSLDCSCGARYSGIESADRNAIYFGESYDDALAAFYAAEEVLLRGDA